MSRNEDAQMAAALAVAMPVIYVSNTMLENLHTGKVPVT